MNNSLENGSFNNSVDGISKSKKLGKMSDRQSIILSILEESLSEDNGIHGVNELNLGGRMNRKSDLDKNAKVQAKRGVSPSLVRYGDL